MARNSSIKLAVVPSCCKPRVDRRSQLWHGLPTVPRSPKALEESEQLHHDSQKLWACYAPAALNSSSIWRISLLSRFDCHQAQAIARSEQATTAQPISLVRESFSIEAMFACG